MDPCECVDMFNTQVLLGHILNLVNSQTECTDSHCFSPSGTDVGGPLSGQIDPSVSFSSIGVALMALLVLALVLPINVRGRSRTSRAAGQQAHKPNGTDKKNHPEDHDDHGHGPGMAM